MSDTEQPRQPRRARAAYRRIRGNNPRYWLDKTGRAWPGQPKYVEGDNPKSFWRYPWKGKDAPAWFEDVRAYVYAWDDLKHKAEHIEDTNKRVITIFAWAWFMAVGITVLLATGLILDHYL